MFKNSKIITKQIERFKDPRVVGLILFGIVSLLVTWSGVKAVQTNFELDKEIATSKQRNEVQRLKNENLRLKNTYFESDQYLELAARRQFGKAAPGEKLYVIPESVAISRTVDMPNQTIAAAQEDSETSSEGGYSANLAAWRDFLFR